MDWAKTTGDWVHLILENWWYIEVMHFLCKSTQNVGAILFTLPLSPACQKTPRPPWKSHPQWDVDISSTEQRSVDVKPGSHIVPGGSDLTQYLWKQLAIYNTGKNAALRSFGYANFVLSPYNYKWNFIVWLSQCNLKKSYFSHSRKISEMRFL